MPVQNTTLESLNKSIKGIFQTIAKEKTIDHLDEQWYKKEKLKDKKLEVDSLKDFQWQQAKKIYDEAYFLWQNNDMDDVTFQENFQSPKLIYEGSRKMFEALHQSKQKKYNEDLNNKVTMYLLKEGVTITKEKFEQMDKEKDLSRKLMVFSGAGIENLKTKKTMEEISKIKQQTATSKAQEKAIEGRKYETKTILNPKTNEVRVISYDKSKGINIPEGFETIETSLMKSRLSKGESGTDKINEKLQLQANSIQGALNKIQGLTGKYSDNQQQIEGLYKDGTITEDEYNEIKGEGWFNLEENMDYVRKILQSKLDELRKMGITSTEMTTETIEGETIESGKTVTPEVQNKVLMIENKLKQALTTEPIESKKVLPKQYGASESWEKKEMPPKKLLRKKIDKSESIEEPTETFESYEIRTLLEDLANLNRELDEPIKPQKTRKITVEYLKFLIKKAKSKINEERE